MPVPLALWRQLINLNRQPTESKMALLFFRFSSGSQVPCIGLVLLRPGASGQFATLSTARPRDTIMARYGYQHCLEPRLLREKGLFGQFVSHNHQPPRWWHVIETALMHVRYEASADRKDQSMILFLLSEIETLKSNDLPSHILRDTQAPDQHLVPWTRLRCPRRLQQALHTSPHRAGR